VTKEQEAELRAIQERLAEYRAMTHAEWELANVDAYWSLCSREAKLLQLLREHGSQSAA
jgi:hypothetical protein